MAHGTSPGLNTLAQKNLEFFSRIRPDLAKILRDVPPAASNPAQDHSDRLASAKDSVILACIGFPSGKVLEALLETHAEYRRVNLLIEHEPAQFSRICHEYDFTKMVNKAEMVILVPELPGELPSLLRGFFTQFNAYSSNMFIFSGDSERLRPEFFEIIKGEIYKAKGMIDLGMGNSVEDSLIGFRNIVENAKNIAASPGIGNLKNAFEGLTAVSIASGPSLNEAMPFLKAHAGKFILIACDSSLQPLLKAGLMPHFVTAIEREEIVTEYFRNMKLDPTVTLIGPNLLLKASVDAFDGIRALYTHSSAISFPLGMDFLGLPFGTGFSAGNLNITAAIHMGFKKIVLAGHNLGFEVGSLTSHAQGVLLEERSRPNQEKDLEQFNLFRVPSQDGKATVVSALGYCLYRSQIEAEILREGSREFINTALKGARIAGAKGMSIEMALSESDYAPENIRERIGTLLAPPSVELQKQRSIEIRNRTKAHVLRVKQHLEKAKSLRKDLIMVRQRLWKGRDDVDVIRAARRISIQIQEFRDAGYSDPDLKYVPHTILIPLVAPLEREVSDLNRRFPQEFDLLINYFNVTEKILNLLILHGPEMVKTMESLLKQPEQSLESSRSAASVNL